MLIMNKNAKTFDFLFESSWEVCNKVGGIYTVLSTKANTLQEVYNDKIIFIGPDIWGDANASDFIEDATLFADWASHAKSKDHLKIKVGRWDIPGKPPVVLIDYKPFFNMRDELYSSMWTNFGVKSMNSYGDYDDSCIFAYAVSKMIESFYRFYKLEAKKVGALFNEWMLGMGVLYMQKNLPKIATLFTTHATSIGRSIAGNDKALYAYMNDYNGDSMAEELNMEAKHSLEKQAARHADCFTTVSDITAVEATQLLTKKPDIVTPNGFEQGFVPKGAAYTTKRAAARETLTKVAEKLLGYHIHEDTLFISTSGRYEYRNKGIDVFIEAMNRLRTSIFYKKETIAFIMVPAWVHDARADLKELIEKDLPSTTPLQTPFTTHWLNNMSEDRTLNHISYLGFTNAANENVKIIFVPCYLDGKDGIFNKPYYDILIGMDATVYPSYYEPWGYTPLESVAFGVPTITTNLAGFGLWAKKMVSGDNIDEGVVVANRTDFNYFDIADSICQAIAELAVRNKNERKTIKNNCLNLAKEAEWSSFISYYDEAFAIAYKNAKKRVK
jgi:Glycosyltransferase